MCQTDGAVSKNIYPVNSVALRGGDAATSIRGEHIVLARTEIIVMGIITPLYYFTI